MMVYSICLKEAEKESTALWKKKKKRETSQMLYSKACQYYLTGELLRSRLETIYFGHKNLTNLEV